ncbi:Hypothetical predicted protein [Paramuricea clavata]|uniref:Uncharacterized protein n=1 Tax=Paramuricea clavata TaxID=317549 RepID=A0A6S7IZ97_PARCT|nr:Hypothetical predicted protein [Paramuricea clavata]
MVSIADDIIIHGKTRQEHYQRLHELLIRAKEKGIKFNKDKLEVGITEVKYFGHLLTDKGLKPDTEKVMTVQSMKLPTVKNELETFLAVYIPFLDTILEQLRFRFNEKTTFAGLFDTLLRTNCAKYGVVEEEFFQFYGNYSQFLHANNVMPHDTGGMNALVHYRLWVAKWKREFSSSTDSSTDHIATLSFCDPNVFPSIYARLTIASILPISTATLSAVFRLYGFSRHICVIEQLKVV